MKVIQSFWSKPFFSFKKSPEAIKWLLMSWAFSIVNLRKFYGVTLVTDKKGKEILIDLLDLPYSHYTSDLDRLDTYPPGLWALGKIAVYQQQNEPFLHVDGDVFITHAFKDKIRASRLIGLHPENSAEENFNYKQRVLFATELLRDIPVELLQDSQFSAINAGILGGSDVQFFHSFSNKVMSFIDTNKKKLEMTIPDGFNMVYEQLLIGQLASAFNASFEFYFPEENMALYDLVDFKSGRKKVFHARGDKRIQYPLMEEILYATVQDLYPELYQHVISCTNILCRKTGVKSRFLNAQARNSIENKNDRKAILSLSEKELGEIALHFSEHATLTQKNRNELLRQIVVDVNVELGQFDGAPKVKFISTDGTTKEIALNFLQTLILQEFIVPASINDVKNLFTDFILKQSNETLVFICDFFKTPDKDALLYKLDNEITMFCKSCICTSILKS